MKFSKACFPLLPLWIWIVFRCQRRSRCCCSHMSDLLTDSQTTRLGWRAFRWPWFPRIFSCLVPNWNWLFIGETSSSLSVDLLKPVDWLNPVPALLRPAWGACGRAGDAWWPPHGDQGRGPQVTHLHHPPGQEPQLPPVEHHHRRDRSSLLPWLPASYGVELHLLSDWGKLMMESLLKVIKWPRRQQEHITFVTRAVRVIDLITNLIMTSFQTQTGFVILIFYVYYTVCTSSWAFPWSSSLSTALL